MKIDLTENQIRDLITVIGAAVPLFRDLAQKEDTLGIYKRWLNNANFLEEISKEIVQQFNEQVGS